ILGPDIGCADEKPTVIEYAVHIECHVKIRGVVLLPEPCAQPRQFLSELIPTNARSRVHKQGLNFVRQTRSCDAQLPLLLLVNRQRPGDPVKKAYSGFWDDDFVRPLRDCVSL